jgi:putative transposase
MDVSDAKKLRALEQQNQKLKRLLAGAEFDKCGENAVRDSTRVANDLERLDPLPKTPVCDNGAELTSKVMILWAQRPGVKLHFIQPGKPTQNAFVESFNGKFREYCLDLNWFTSLEDARLSIDSWRAHYNHVRPHRSLNRKPPVVFAASVA